MRVTTRLGAALQLLSSVQAYLTTVEISLSYCPAPSLTLARGIGNTTPAWVPAPPLATQLIRATDLGPLYHVVCMYGKARLDLTDISRLRAPSCWTHKKHRSSRFHQQASL